MELKQAEQLAHSKLAEHNLHDIKFAWGNAKTQFGSYRHSTSTITISAVLTQLNSIERFTNTLLHEIAHALTPNQGHSRQWQLVAKHIGCDAQRCYNSAEVARPAKRWQAQCTTCKRIVVRYKRARIACAVCCNKYNGGKFDETYRFNFIPYETD